MWIKGQKSASLSGNTIVLAVTGSIGAVRVIELARELIRSVAEVYGVMSAAEQHIIHSDAFHYATGHEVITDLAGEVENVKFCGADGCADLLLIAPGTANTIGKMACGVDDTPVTTFATTAIGSGIPVIVVPAMHNSMYEHPAVMENVDKLKGCLKVDMINVRPLPVGRNSHIPPILPTHIRKRMAHCPERTTPSLFHQ